jgi:hypothetical protein
MIQRRIIAAAFLRFAVGIKRSDERANAFRPGERDKPYSSLADADIIATSELPSVLRDGSAWGGGSSHQGFDPFRGNLASCRDAGVVARAFPMSRRQGALSLTHHAEVASLKPDPADELLRWAKEPMATQEWLDIAKLAS